jgi:2-succinyl-5-enolpyruvyl-6-hydroxy-3-cyclohexene-1-carboxylate synthase
MSVSSASATQATFCATIVDEWVRSGLTDVVICPGSRSTPLTLALSSRQEVTCFVRVDERSAAFFALGRALATARPVVILVTSGTAATELHAAVAEADLARVSLIVVTADRPPELRDVGAAQTITQVQLFGSMVRAFVEPGVARDEARGSWRPMASRVWRVASGLDDVPRGPVHLNVAFIEPLVATPGELPPGRDDGATWTYAPVVPSPRSAIDIAGKRVLCVVGAGVNAAMIIELWSLDWAVIGDATSQHTLPYADPLLRDDEVAERLRPDVVVRLGGVPASKVLAQRLREWDAHVVGFTGAGFLADPDGLVRDRLPGLPDGRATHLRGDAAFVQGWAQCSRQVGEHLAAMDAGSWSEVSVARACVDAAAASEAALVVGSSMPVRDVEWWSPSRVTPTFANRGANGIDGVLSTALGVATHQAAVALVGDITFLHDVSALVDGVDENARAVVVVADNHGGGIFNFLPQATALETEHFEKLFATPRPHDLVAVAAAFGHHAQRVSELNELRDALRAGLERPGISVIVAALPPREANVVTHSELNAAVAGWLTW